MIYSLFCWLILVLLGAREVGEVHGNFASGRGTVKPFPQEKRLKD
jgi:hypothetical protein